MGDAGISVTFEAAAPFFSTPRQNRFSLQFDGAEIRTASGGGDKLSQDFISIFFFSNAWRVQVRLDLDQFFYDPLERRVQLKCINNRTSTAHQSIKI